MFPETFVQKNLVYSKEGDLVLDPFSGRGTTVFQSLLSNRQAIAIDVNPIAVCVSRAKANAPSETDVLERIGYLKKRFILTQQAPERSDPFFQLCFSKNTLEQILYLRKMLKWRESQVDCFIAAMALGRLHGESVQSSSYFSNQMPRTISTKPNYSVNWWLKNKHQPPARDVFAILSNETAFRFLTPPPKRKGVVMEGDARNAGRLFSRRKGKVNLVITSPPYLDTTNFAEDQWLRNWFLGGNTNPNNISNDDHRHSNRQKYWEFLKESFAGISPLLAPKSVLVIRIGGKKIEFAEAENELRNSLKVSTGKRVTLRSAHVSKIGDGQLKTFSPHAVGSKREFDFVFSLS